MSKFRVGFNASVEIGGAIYMSEIYRSYETAKLVLDSIANYTLSLHERGLMEDYSNYGWVEQQVDGNWVEFEEDTWHQG